MDDRTHKILSLKPHEYNNFGLPEETAKNSWLAKPQPSNPRTNYDNSNRSIISKHTITTFSTNNRADVKIRYKNVPDNEIPKIEDNFWATWQAFFKLFPADGVTNTQHCTYIKVPANEMRARVLGSYNSSSWADSLGGFTYNANAKTWTCVIEVSDGLSPIQKVLTDTHEGVHAFTAHKMHGHDGSRLVIEGAARFMETKIEQQKYNTSTVLTQTLGYVKEILDAIPPTTTHLTREEVFSPNSPLHANSMFKYEGGCVIVAKDPEAVNSYFNCVAAAGQYNNCVESNFPSEYSVEELKAVMEDMRFSANLPTIDNPLSDLTTNKPKLSPKTVNPVKDGSYIVVICTPEQDDIRVFKCSKEVIDSFKTTGSSEAASAMLQNNCTVSPAKTIPSHTNIISGVTAQQVMDISVETDTISSISKSRGGTFQQTAHATANRHDTQDCYSRLVPDAREEINRVITKKTTHPSNNHCLDLENAIDHTHTKVSNCYFGRQSNLLEDTINWDSQDLSLTGDSHNIIPDAA